MATHAILDSKFSANRTDLRGWRELWFIGTAVWSQEEEDQLRRDCLTTTDTVLTNPPTSSNAAVWAAVFERYGVPLSDLFTYGLKPHPDSTRGPRAKQLTPLCCQLLTVALVHPIFQARLNLVRYILQRIVCLRMGAHEPPLGPAPTDMDDNTCSALASAAEASLTKDASEKERTEANHDALWLYMQEKGAHMHPELVKLEEALKVAMQLGNVPQYMPRDYAPNCGRLFYLQLWDLQFLVQVLNGMASPRGYLPAEKYYMQWLEVTHRVRPYIMKKFDELTEAWFLRDERNYRVRQKLKQTDPGRIVYDIAEEDFRPLYIQSKYITEGMRAVLRGDHLTAICLPDQEDGSDVEMQGCSDDTESLSGGSEDSLASDRHDLSIAVNVLMDTVEKDADEDVEMVVAGPEDLGASDDDYVPSDQESDVEVEKHTGTVPDKQPPRSRRQCRSRSRSQSIVSVFSISSSAADDWEYNDTEPSRTQNEYIAHRGLAWEDTSRPAFRRRQDHDQDEDFNEAGHERPVNGEAERERPVFHEV